MGGEEEKLWPLQQPHSQLIRGKAAEAAAEQQNPTSSLFLSINSILFCILFHTKMRHYCTSLFEQKRPWKLFMASEAAQLL